LIQINIEVLGNFSGFHHRGRRKLNQRRICIGKIADFYTCSSLKPSLWRIMKKMSREIEEISGAFCDCSTKAGPVEELKN
jgi:hypothetical protein